MRFRQGADQNEMKFNMELKKTGTVDLNQSWRFRLKILDGPQKDSHFEQILTFEFSMPSDKMKVGQKDFNNFIGICQYNLVDYLSEMPKEIVHKLDILSGTAYKGTMEMRIVATQCSVVEKERIKDHQEADQITGLKAKEKEVVQSLNAEEQEEEDMAFNRSPTYMKFFHKIADYIWTDSMWPPKKLIPKEADNVCSYAHCMWLAKDDLIQSIVERDPSFFNQEELQNLREDDFGTFQRDIETALFPPILDKLSKSLGNI
jgi:hypothetical protein